MVKVKENGAWIDATGYGAPQGVISLKRAYTATEVALWGNGVVYELRVGGGAAAAPPRLKSGSPTAVAPNVSTVPASWFETQSPYAAGAISLAATPTSQNGVTLTASSGAVEILSRPSDRNVDIVVFVDTPDGLRTRQLLQVQSSVGPASTPSLPIGLTTGSQTPVKSSGAQSDWNVLYDGTTSTYVPFTTSNNAGVRFASPATFDRVYVDANTSYIVKVKQDGVWVDLTDMIGTKGTVVLRRPVTASEVAVWGNGTLYEFRVGGAAVQPAS
jgi:hypothetical protein